MAKTDWHPITRMFGPIHPRDLWSFYDLGWMTAEDFRINKKNLGEYGNRLQEEWDRNGGSWKPKSTGGK